MIMRVASLLCGMAFALIAIVHPAAADEKYPAKPIKLIVPYPAGGGGDAVFRLVTEPLAARLGQPVYFDYKAGAGGTIGLNALAKSEANGYSLGVASSDAVALAPNFFTKLPYDPQKDIQPIAIVAEMPLVLLVKADSPIGSFKELLKMGFEKPGTITYGTPGAGSSPHIMGALLSKGSGVELTHVPYKGTAPAIQDLLSGQVSAIITSGFDSVPLEKAGRVRTILVTGTQRYPLLPNTPTAKEAGIDLVDDLKVWFGIFAPSAVPKPVIDRLSREIAQIISTEKFKVKSAELGFVPVRISPDQFRARLRDDTLRLAAFVRRTGVRQE